MQKIPPPPLPGNNPLIEFIIDFMLQVANYVATMRSRTSRTPTRDLDVTDVRIKASLKDVSLELTTVKEPLLKASASG